MIGLLVLIVLVIAAIVIISIVKKKTKINKGADDTIKPK
jgi:hypothetical protein